MERIRLERLDAATHGIFEGPVIIGWLRGDAVGFVGFDDYAHARRAGELAAGVLAGWYGARAASRPAELRDPAFPDAQLTVDRVVAGRILGPGAVPVGDGDAFAYEFAVPKGTWIAVQLELVQRIRRETLVAGLLPRLGGLASEVGA